MYAKTVDSGWKEGGRQSGGRKWGGEGIVQTAALMLPRIDKTDRRAGVGRVPGGVEED